MLAQKYLTFFRHTCTFHDDPHSDMAPTEWIPCRAPAVAVYVSDDEEPLAKFVCVRHAAEAEDQGDGPVFWMRDIEKVDKPGEGV